MPIIVFILALLASFSVQANDYTLQLSGDSSSACSLTMPAASLVADGTFALESGDVTAFDCTISEASLTLDETDLQFSAGAYYRVSGGEMTALNVQTTGPNELQIGTMGDGAVGAGWSLFGTGTILTNPANRVTVSTAAGSSAPTYLGSAGYGTTSEVATHTFNATLPAGSNRVLLVFYTLRDAGDFFSVTSVKYGGSGGTALTLLDYHRPDSGTVHEGGIYYLKESDLSGYSGDNDVYILLNGGTAIAATAVFIGGVNQTTPFGAVSNADFLAGSSAITVSPASTANDLVVGAGFWDEAGGSDPSAVTSPATERVRAEETVNNRRWSLVATTAGQASSTAIGWGTPAQTYQDVYISGFAVQP